MTYFTLNSQFTLHFVVLERWLIATEIDMRTFVQNEGIFIIVGITTCRKTNKLCILKCIKLLQATFIVQNSHKAVHCECF